MSLARPKTHRLESGPSAELPPGATIDQLIQHKLILAIRTMRSSEADSMSLAAPALGTPGNPLAGLGDYLHRMSFMLAQLMIELTDESLMDRVMAEANGRAHKVSGLADLRGPLEVDEERSKLCHLKALSIKYHSEVQAAWDDDVALQPDLDQSRAQIDMMDYEPTPLETRRPKLIMPKGAESSPGDPGSSCPSSGRKTLPDQAQIDSSHRDDPPREISSDQEHMANYNVDLFKRRGKGHHTCPRGLACKKGGVGKDGQLIIFERNSAFVQHCNKHKKPWTCDREGCPNPPDKRRFARRDGLQRHQETVKHGDAAKSPASISTGSRSSREPTSRGSILKPEFNYVEPAHDPSSPARPLTATTAEPESLSPALIKTENG